MLPTITNNTINLPPGTRVQFPATFERLLEQLSDRASIRIRFRDNYIFLMAPLPEHGNQADVISDLVKALLRYQGRDWQSFDPSSSRCITSPCKPLPKLTGTNSPSTSS